MLGGAAAVELGGVTVTSASGAAAWGSMWGADSDPAGSEAAPASMFEELTLLALAESASAPVFATSEVACSSNSERPESKDASEEEVSAKYSLPDLEIGRASCRERVCLYV